jgi:hypothetical protein
LLHNVAGQDGVDFDGIKLWNHEVISWIVVVVSVVSLERSDLSFIDTGK